MNITKNLRNMTFAAMAFAMVACGGNNTTSTETAEAGTDSTKTEVANAANTTAANMPSAEEISKAFGLVIVDDIATNLKMSKAELNAEAFINSFKLAYASSPADMKPEEMKVKQEKVQALMQMDTITDAAQIKEGSSLIGEMIGMNVQRMEMPINMDVFVSTFTSVMEGEDVGLTVEEATKTMEAYSKAKQEEMMAKQQQMMAEQAKKDQEMAKPNIEAGAKFLAENGQKEGVVTTASGLQYKVIKEGKGAKPTAADKVKTHYHGTLIDGTVFDSSVDRGEPIEFPVGGVIQGWQEALQLMTVGSKYQLYIPYELAYGPRAAGQIPPGSTLIFDVELLDIVK